MTERFIWTYGGKRISLLAPDLTLFTIADLAGPLSRICRWTGHVSEHYSVAQHCVICSYLTAPEYSLLALAHDMHEVVAGDCSTPVKRLLRDFGDVTGPSPIDDMADCFDAAILRRFGINLRAAAQQVKDADLACAIYEARALVRVPEAEIVKWFGLDAVARADALAALLPATPEQMTRPMAPLDAERVFLDRWQELGGKT